MYEKHLLNKKIETAEALQLEEDKKAEKEKAEKQSRSTTTRRRSTAQNPIIKVLTSATFIRSVFGILKRVMK